MTSKIAYAATADDLANEDWYLIWSNEHRAWWGPAEHGYSIGLHGAGIYLRSAALRICRDAIPTAGHIGAISEIPVRRADVYTFLQGQMVPSCIFIKA